MMGRVGGVVFVKVDQGALGHKRRKPTWLITNIEEVILLDGTTDVRPRPPWPRSIGDSQFPLAEWAPEL